MTTRFHGLTFVTDPGRVFSPRPTSERLVDAALGRVAGEPARIADVGTGSGVVAITLALRAPQIDVWASDTCPARSMSRRSTPTGSARACISCEATSSTGSRATST